MTVFLLQSPLRLLCFVLTLPLCVSQAYAVNVRITNLTNITVPLWINGDPAIVRTMLVCVYHDTIRTYGITAVASGGSFALRGGIYSLPYTLSWNDGGAANPAGGATAQLVHNVKLSNRNNARIATDVPANSTDCNAGASPTAQMTITFSTSALDAARDATYTGTITLIASAT